MIVITKIVTAKNLVAEHLMSIMTLSASENFLLSV